MSYRALLIAVSSLVFVPSIAHAELLVRYRLEAVDALNQPVTTVTLGQAFTLRGYVEDLRPDPELHGLAAAYLGAFLYPSKVESIGPLTLDPFFTDLFPLAALEPNFLAAGGVALVTDPADLPPAGEQLVFSVPMRGVSVGVAPFAPSLVDGDDLEWLLFGYDPPVLPAEIEMVGLQLNVVIPEPSTWALALCGMMGAVIVRLRSRERRCEISGSRPAKSRFSVRRRPPRLSCVARPCIAWRPCSERDAVAYDPARET